jgi:acetolactate decarboxylase
MKKITAAILAICLVSVLTGCYRNYSDTISQVSTIDAILAGVYDGQLTGKELLEHGDFGIGTFDGLDGEMIVLDKTIYQVKADGTVHRPSPATKTPFAVVVPFAADRQISIPAGLDLAAFQQFVDNNLPNKNLFYAIRVTGRFNTMKTRSVPAQEKPYPPLVEVTKQQSVFNMNNVSGTLVGFKSPAYVKGINVPGYHVHFLTDDLAAGGHVLDFTIAGGTVEIDSCNKFFMILPDDGGAFGAVDLERDRSEELHKAER